MNYERSNKKEENKDYVLCQKWCLMQQTTRTLINIGTNLG